MHKDVFGTEGDFITSPEISQMFGEVRKLIITINYIFIINAANSHLKVSTNKIQKYNICQVIALNILIVK